jgi:hypothetical protein
MNTQHTVMKTPAKKNTRTATILFKFNGAERGKVLVGTKNPFDGMVYTSKLRQEFIADMPNRTFKREQYKEYLKVLTDEQIDLFLQENIDVYSRSDVEKMFTFFLEQGQFGHVYLTQQLYCCGTDGEVRLSQ